MKTENSLTHGNIYSTLIKFAFPFLLANLLQALYGAADLLIVGHFSDSAGISAVATGSHIIQTITGLITGLTTGATILIGQYLGGNRKEDVIETIGSMLSFFTIVAVILTLLMVLGATPIVSIMQAPPEAFEQTVHYTLICSWGIVFIFGYNAISAMLRGLGDSKNPLFFIAIACVCNIVGDFILVGGFKLGAPGAAIATVFSQGISLTLSIILLKRKKFIFDFKWERFRLKKTKIKNLLTLGFPIALQECLVMISFLFITAIVNRMGVTASASLGVAEKINGFILLPPAAFSAAIAAMVAQNMGAGLTNRAKKILNIGMGTSLIFGLAFFIWFQIAPELAAAIFTSDSKVVSSAALYLRSFSIDCIFVCFVFCMNGFFNGCGHTRFTMANSLLATFLIRVPTAFILGNLPEATLYHIGWAAPLASSLSIIMGIVYLKMGRWKVSKL